MGGSINKKTELVVGIIGAVILLFLWHLITVSGNIIPNSILPNPFKVLFSYGEMFKESELLVHTWSTIRLNLMAYVYALLIAIPLGFIIGLYPITNALFSKYIDGVRYTPMTAVGGVFLAIFGLTFTMKANFLAFGVFIYILPVVVQRVRDLQNPANANDHVLLQTIQTLGATQWQKFRYVYLPYVMERVSTDVINLTAVSYTYVCFAEVLFKEYGIGALIHTMSRQSKTPEVFALLFLIIIIGVVQDIILKYLDKQLFPSKYNLPKFKFKNLFVK
jgi:NitT/TauT family transport system permease protein